MKRIILIAIFWIALSPVTYSASSTSYEPDIPPVAVLSIRNNTGNVENTSGTTATIFTFDGNGSHDEETRASELEVRFDFENDGKLDTYFSRTKRATHTYETPGLKTVRMDVLDLQGNVTSTTAQVYVVQNTPPDAYLTVQPKSGTPGVTFNIDASHSTDSQYKSYLLEYRFDFDGDGRYDTAYERKNRIKHIFDSPGTKNVTVQVKDPEGAVNTYSEKITVLPNTPPKAAFTVEELRSNEDVAVYKLDASDSNDPDGSKLTYKWDFNYTGVNDIQWSTNEYHSPFTYAYFYRPGEYIIKLLVKDLDGATNVSFQSIFVRLAPYIAQIK